MRTFLVLEGAKALDEPGGEYRLLTGQVMAEPGLIVWGARALSTAPDATLAEVAEAARAKGFTLFALPTRDVKPDAPEVTTTEVTHGGRTVLVLRRTDAPEAPARVRWPEDDGRNREVELPAFLADLIAPRNGGRKGSGKLAIASDDAHEGETPSGGPDAPGGPGKRRTKRPADA